MKKLVSIMLLMLAFCSLTVITYADDTASGFGGSYMTGSGGTGAWSSDRSGYRIYITDQQCNRVSNYVDFLRKEPVLGSKAAVLTGGKIDNLKPAAPSIAAADQAFPWDYYVMSDIPDPENIILLARKKLGKTEKI